MKKRKKMLRNAAASMAIACLGVLGAVTPASAASSYLYRNNGGSIYLTQTMNAKSGALIKSGVGFTMQCWTTGPNTNFFGNYWTAKYFYGTAHTSTKGNIRGYVTASVVANQTSVGHC